MMTVASRLAEGSHRPDARFHSALDAGYLGWRYARCPAFRYHVAVGDGQRALVIYRTRRRFDLAELTICDVLFERSRHGVREAAAVIRGLRRAAAGDYCIVAARGDPLESVVFSAAGLLPLPRVGPILTVRRLAYPRTLPQPESMASWAPSIGDLELF
jgi:hypothetical protein